MNPQLYLADSVLSPQRDSDTILEDTGSIGETEFDFDSTVVSTRAYRGAMAMAKAAVKERNSPGRTTSRDLPGQSGIHGSAIMSPPAAEGIHSQGTAIFKTYPERRHHIPSISSSSIPPLPAGGQLPPSRAVENLRTKKENIIRRAIKGLRTPVPTNLHRVEEMLLTLLKEVEGPDNAELLGHHTSSVPASSIPEPLVDQKSLEEFSREMERKVELERRRFEETRRA